MCTLSAEVHGQLSASEFGMQLRAALNKWKADGTGGVSWPEQQAQPPVNKPTQIRDGFKNQLYLEIWLRTGLSHVQHFAAKLS